MSSFKKIKKASKYPDCKNSGKGSLLKYYGVKTERRVFIGWVWKTRNAVKEITNNGKAAFKLAPVWSALVKYVVPVLIGIIFVTSSGVLDIF